MSAEKIHKLQRQRDELATELAKIQGLLSGCRDKRHMRPALISRHNEIAEKLRTVKRWLKESGMAIEDEKNSDYLRMFMEVVKRKVAPDTYDAWHLEARSIFEDRVEMADLTEDAE